MTTEEKARAWDALQIEMTNNGFELDPVTMIRNLMNDYNIRIEAESELLGFETTARIATRAEMLKRLQDDKNH
jgi:hypothetical protein